MQDFALLETLLWEPPAGYFLLDRHMQRLAASAAHFRFDVDEARVRRALERFAARLPDRPRKVRLEVAADGGTRMSDADAPPATPVTAAIADRPVNSSDEFLYHKTTRREVYSGALAAHPEAADVILWNERGEITETCNANLVLDIDGRRLTPHAAAGLLPGTFRAALLEGGEIEEASLNLADLRRASAIYMVNSVRRWCGIRLTAQGVHRLSR